MGSVIYRCPATGLNVQTWVVDEFAPNVKGSDYVSLGCLVCQHTHFVNPRTGHVLGQPSAPKD